MGGWGRSIALAHGGGDGSEPRLHHCTPAWARGWDSVSKKTQTDNNLNNIFRPLKWYKITHKKMI